MNTRKIDRLFYGLWNENFRSSIDRVVCAVNDANNELDAIKQLHANLLYACKMAKTYGSQGDIDENVEIRSVSTLLDNAIREGEAL